MHTGRKARIMNNSKAAKRQFRVMIVTAALILCIGAVIVSVSVSQNRRGRGAEDTTAESLTQDSAAHTESSAPAEQPAHGTEKAPEEESAKADETTPAAEDVKPTAVPDPLPAFIAPVSGMLMKEHSMDVPVFSVTMEDYRTHTGVDIAASAGTAVRAAADGTVAEIWEDPMMGHCISITHSGGAQSVYKNLSPETPEEITVGCDVKAGTVIGSVGESALAEIAEESHLHYELHINGAAADPADFMLIGTTDTSYEG